MGALSARFRAAHRRAVPLILLLVLTVGGVAPNWSGARAAVAQPTKGCPQIMLPAYFDYSEQWQTTANTPQVGIVVLNLQSGPGFGKAPRIVRRVRDVQAKGMRVVGYVQTDLGERPAKKVVAEIKEYAAWYGVDGIFLDEVPSAARYIPYYRDLAAAVRRETGRGQEDGLVVLNPGYTPARGYMAFADVIVNYEYYFNRYLTQDFPNWVREYPANRFAHWIHDVPATQESLNAVLRVANQENAGYVFVTERDHPYQYHALPRIWSATASAISC